MEEEAAKNSLLPAILWRNSVDTAKIFCVNGDYLADISAVGILDAMMGETYDYDIYPVINAQNLVIADLPCSGLGVFGKKPDLKYRVKEEDLKELAGLQRKILENAQAMVKKGGTLLYSTCTIDPMENEENVHWFLKKYPQFSLNSIREKLCPQLAESVEEEGCIQLLPGIHCSDGFFIARLKKNGEN